jgi:hypothetical protein
MDAGKRIRTFVGTKPTDLESVPFDRSGIPALQFKEIKLLKTLSLKKIKKTASKFRLLTETTAIDVVSLASVFGMRTGVSTQLWPSSIFLLYESF